MVGAMTSVGVDVGGTNTKTVVLHDGSVLEQRTSVTVRGTPAETAAGVARAISAIADRYSTVDAIGVTLPGHCDADGTAVIMPNLPGDWAGVPIRALLESDVGRPVTIVNDARAFGLAEATLGAARDAETAVGLVLGTGIGGVILMCGRIHSGAAGQAGEIGHQVLDPHGPPCGCGNRGCLEALARADVVAAAAGQPTMHDTARAARRGDPMALTALADAARWVGHGLANVVTVLQPDVIFIGGGVAEAGDALLRPIRNTIERLTPLVPADSYRVVPGILGAWAGAIGAALSAGLAG